MNKTKTTYERPTTELFVIRFEENIMSPVFGSQGAAGATLGLGDDENDYGEF